MNSSIYKNPEKRNIFSGIRQLPARNLQLLDQKNNAATEEKDRGFFVWAKNGKKRRRTGLGFGRVWSAMSSPVFLLFFASFLLAQPGWREDFESPSTTSWKVLVAGGSEQILEHSRVTGDFRAGRRSEHLRMTFLSDELVVLGHRIGFPYVIEDLRISAFLKTTRGDLVFAAEVVLPHSNNPMTGRPLSLLVPATGAIPKGQWTRITLENLPIRLSRQAGELQETMGMSLELSGAYIRRVVLIVHGSRDQVVDLWIDDLSAQGHAAVSDQDLPRDENNPVFRPANFDRFEKSSGKDSFSSSAFEKPEGPIAFSAEKAGPWHPAASSGENAASTGPVSNVPRFPSSASKIRMVGPMLTINNRRTSIRAIEYQGEPLDFLKRLGFNAVWLRDRPDEALLSEARRVGIWLIAPPPSRDALQAGSGDSEDWASTNISPIGSRYDIVLAWDLGRHCVKSDFPEIRDWAEVVRTADRVQKRPVLCTVDSGILEYSRLADLLLIDRQPLLTSTELCDYGRWLLLYPRLARPGTPIWSTVQTEPARETLRQWEMIAPSARRMAPISFEQMRMLAHLAIAGGSRGLMFTSSSPLTAQDSRTKYRADSLELINLELALIHSWLAGGKVETIVDAQELPISAAILQTDYARLFLPLWCGRQSQYCVGQAARNNVSFILPGIPETYNAYLLLPGGMRPLYPERRAGGMYLQLEEASTNSLILLTQAETVYTVMAKRARKAGERAATLSRTLASMRLQAVEDTLERIQKKRTRGMLPVLQGNTPLLGLTEQQTLLAGTRQALGTCDALIGSKDYSSAYLQAERATRALRITERAMWQDATRAVHSPVTTPVSVNFSTLPSFLEMYGKIATASLGENLLPGGDCETIEAWGGENGWKHYQHPLEKIGSVATLSQSSAHQGERGIRMAVFSKDTENPILQLETAPVWLATPPVDVEAEKIYCLHGWIHLPEKLTGSIDGLMILDSIGGTPLALRFTEKTDGWQEFAMYRYAPSDGRLALTFALSGMGEVWLDDISIREVRTDAIASQAAPPVPVRSPETPSWRRPFDQLFTR
jgi:hypothetical protein